MDAVSGNMVGGDVDSSPPAVSTNAPTPVRKIKTDTLRVLGGELTTLFTRYSSDRRNAELRYIRNLRQYLGIYDPEVDSKLGKDRSRAYPRITRVKCVSVLSRIMNLMYPGNEKNWSLDASPSAEMDPRDVAEAVQKLLAERQGDGVQTPIDEDLIDYAIQRLAGERAQKLSDLIDDQLQELGGDQTMDVIQLDRKVTQSSIMYGLGLLEGPFVRTEQKSGWTVSPDGKTYTPVTRDVYKPQFDFLSVWDFYPDMNAKKLPGEGYFIRKVMGRSGLRKLADRTDFMGDEIKKIIEMNPRGNFQPKEFETNLRTMGVAVNVSDLPTDAAGKYEVLVYKGPITGHKLSEVGADVPEDQLVDEIDAEIWICANRIIKADINQWSKLGMNVKTVHCFSFDEDDTSPIGNGLPNVMRDSQMSISAAVRMTLDNASITCGPNLEVNTTLLRTDQDLTSIEPYKIWYRDDDGPSAQFPAVRRIEIDGHLPELQALIKLFMDFADVETFVGPATGGDMAQVPSEPMRTAAGASMVRGEAALPFKDIIRNFDMYKQSTILSLVQFNKKFNPTLAPEGDYNVVARGATSLIAKEVRGSQLDMLAQSLTPEERDHVDDRKFIMQRFAVRDMADLLVPEEEAERKQQVREQSQQAQQALQEKNAEAQERFLLSQAYKNMTQGQKNSAATDATTANTALDILERGSQPDGPQKGN